MSRGQARSALGTIGVGVRELLAVRWVRWLVLFGLVLVLGRLFLEFALARTVSVLASQRELECHWEELELSLLGGRGEVRRLEVRAREADRERPLLLEVEYAVFDLGILDLLRGRLTIERVEVDGLDAYVERDSEGEWNLERHLAAAETLSVIEADPQAPASRGSAPEARDGRAQPFRLAPPLAVSALRLQHARLNLVDHTQDPPGRHRFEASLGLSNLGIGERPVRFTLALFAQEVLDGAHIDGEALWGEESIRLQARLQAGGLRPSALAAYLAELGWEARCDSLAARGEIALEVAVEGPDRDRVRAEFTLRELSLGADGGKDFGLGTLRFELKSFTRESAALGQLSLEGIRAHLALEADGALKVAGLARLPRPALPAAPPDWAARLSSWLRLGQAQDLPSWSRLFLREDPTAYPWSLAGIVVRDARFELSDRAITPPVDLAWIVDEVELGSLEHAPASSREPVPLRASFRSPGVIENVRVEGELQPLAPSRRLDLRIEGEGIGLSAVNPYLGQAGLERALEQGSFRARLLAEADTDERGRTEGWLQLEEIALGEESELFGVRNVGVRGLVLDPSENRCEIGEVLIEGPRFVLSRDPSRGLLAFGLRTGGGAADAAPRGNALAQPAGDEAAHAETPEPPRIEIGRIAWLGTRVDFVDSTLDPPSRFAIEEMGFEVKGLSLGGSPERPDPPPASWNARLRIPGVIDLLSGEGTLQPSAGSFDLDGQGVVEGSGLTGHLTAPYLQALSVAPELADGRFEAKLGGSLRAGALGWSADLRLADVALSDPTRELAALGELEVSGLRLGARPRIERLVVSGAQLRAERGEDGSLALLGVRILPPPPVDPAQPLSEPQPLQLPELPPFELGELDLRGTRLHWIDRAARPAVDVVLELDLAARDLDTTSGKPGPFSLRLGASAWLDALSLEGSLELTGERWRIASQCSLDTGSEAGTLAGYLPAGLIPLASRLEVQPELVLEGRPEGGLGATARLASMSWRSATSELPWLGWEEIELSLERLDPARGVLELGRLTGRGLEVSLQRAREGGWRMFAMEIVPTQATSHVGKGWSLPPLPDIPVDSFVPTRMTWEGGRFDLGLRVVDAQLGDGARPIEVAAELTLDGPEQVFPTDDEAPPLRVRLQAGAPGLVERADWTLDLRPFADSPSARTSVEATGLQTTRLAEFWPWTRGQLQGLMDSGELTGKASIDLDVRRARPFEIGLSRPFEAEARLSELYLRASPDGPLLAGVEAIGIEGIRIDPKRNRARVQTIEIQKPVARLERWADGIGALGVRYPTGAEEAQPQEDAPPPKRPEPIAPTDDEPRQGGELSIDEILLAGLDVRLVDRSVDPPLVLPLSELDGEIRRFTTRALEEPRPILFNAYLGSGTPEEAGSATFDELTFAGQLALVPAPQGWTSLGLSGLDLSAFAPLAAGYGIELEQGILDLTARTRWKGDKGARFDSAITFTDLDLAEEEGGLLQETLGLPTSIDAVLALLRSPDGEHRFQVGFGLGPDGIHQREVLLAATRTLAGVIGRAVASAPLKVVGNFVPLGSADASRVWQLEFAPGSSDLTSSSRELLEQLTPRLQAHPRTEVLLQAELGALDVERTSLLANPRPEECLELVTGVRQRRKECQRRRDVAAAQARSLLALGQRTDAQAALDQVRAVELELFQADADLEHYLDVLRKDSERERLKRTRHASRLLSQARLENVRRFLAERRSRPGAEEFELRPPRRDAAPGLSEGRVLLELREP